MLPALTSLCHCLPLRLVYIPFPLVYPWLVLSAPPSCSAARTTFTLFFGCRRSSPHVSVSLPSLALRPLGCLRLRRLKLPVPPGIWGLQCYLRVLADPRLLPLSLYYSPPTAADAVFPALPMGLVVLLQALALTRALGLAPSFAEAPFPLHLVRSTFLRASHGRSLPLLSLCFFPPSCAFAAWAPFLSHRCFSGGWLCPGSLGRPFFEVESTLTITPISCARTFPLLCVGVYPSSTLPSCVAVGFQVPGCRTPASLPAELLLTALSLHPRQRRPGDWRCMTISSSWSHNLYHAALPHVHPAC